MGTRAARDVTHHEGEIRIRMGAGEARIAQVAHRRTRPFDTQTAATVLSKVSSKLPDKTRIVITGGGFVSLEYPRTSVPHPTRREQKFLDHLRSWTLKKVAPLVSALQKTQKREFLVGVDVLVGGEGSGQFGLWVGESGPILVSKRLPVEKESVYLAGVDTSQTTNGPRVVESSIGRVMILVCHDAQAFNHLTKHRVQRAQTLTPRGRAIRELERIAEEEKPEWAFNLIHSVRKDGSVTKFRTSFKQIHTDCDSHPSVLGAFGYGFGKQGVAAQWLTGLRYPEGTEAIPVVIESSVMNRSTQDDSLME